MPVAVTDNCRRCRFTECVTVCPVACFHGDDEMLYVDPESCIDCKACIPVCPVGAIKDPEELVGGDVDWLRINAQRSLETPSIFEKCDPLPTAEERRRELGR